MHLALGWVDFLVVPFAARETGETTHCLKIVRDMLKLEIWHVNTYTCVVLEMNLLVQGLP